MTFFFELLTKEIGLSRTGRILLSKEFKRFVSTPNTVIPLKKYLLSMVSFLEEFEKHQIFIISKMMFLKFAFIQDKFKDNGFIYTHYGTLKRFQEILDENIEIFSQDNLIALIPFNNPSYVVNREFAKIEINHYLKTVVNLLEEHPNLNFGVTVKLFDYPDLIEEYIGLFKNFNNIKLLNFEDLFNSIENFRRILKVIIQIKSELDPNLVLMISGKIIPKFYPILVYLGFDLIDASYSLFLASKYFYTTIEYSIPLHKMKYFPCSCSSCKTRLLDLNSNTPSREKVELLSLHNLTIFNNYMQKIKQYLKTEDFRFFVEKSSNDETNIISLLRILDKEYLEFICGETPVIQERRTINSIGPSSYYRPDFVRFRKRVVEAFTPEIWTELIVLLPCSSKKPYSLSKSHSKFHSVMKKKGNFSQIQEFILTSPLGVIPRQLETIYPANSYDIPVTGEWDEMETRITKNMLIKFLEKYDSRIPIICHLPEGGYRRIINTVINETNYHFHFTELVGSTTSHESLTSLEKLIEKFNPNSPLSIPKVEGYKRNLEKIIDYHYGKNTGSLLLSGNCKIKTDRRRKVALIIDSNSKSNLGKFNQVTGELELTFEGANKIKDHFRKHQFLIFNDKQVKGSTLFRPGIFEYSLDLKPKEYAMIWDNEKQNIVAIAKMIVGTSFLKNSKSGRIAEIINKSGKK